LFEFAAADGTIREVGLEFCAVVTLEGVESV
jgi:hypothetical protein